MHKARSFFFVCLGIFLLALAYHLGAVGALAQAPGDPIVGVAGQGGRWFAVTANGQTFYADYNGTTWTRAVDIFSGSPTPAAQPTWGQLKSQYRQPASGASQDK
jgi:hypothetical protein